MRRSRHPNRVSDFDIGRRHSEATGNLASGNRFHVTRDRVEIYDPSGALIQTLQPPDIASTRRVNNTVTMTRRSGDDIQFVVGTRDEAAFLNGIFGSHPDVQVKYVDNPFAAGGNPPWLTIAILVVFVLVLGCIVVLFGYIAVAFLVISWT